MICLSVYLSELFIWLFSSMSKQENSAVQAFLFPQMIGTKAWNKFLKCSQHCWFFVSQNNDIEHYFLNVAVPFCIEKLSTVELT